MHIFCRMFLSNYWWQESDIWSQASYRYAILWEAFLDPSDSYFLFADLVDFYTHWTYMHIFHYIFLSNYWWQRSDMWSQASYRYPILWEAFLNPSDSYFLFAKERGYHRWALAHSSSCSIRIIHKWPTLVVIGTDCTDSCKSNYHMIMTTPRRRINVVKTIITLIEILHHTLTILWYQEDESILNNKKKMLQCQF